MNTDISKTDSANPKETPDELKTKVLIVDDEPAIREVLELILQEWGYDVRLAANGSEAKDLVESYDPEIVISDVVMPQLSGLDLLRCLKAGNPNRPVILVTAHASIDLAVESMKQGAQDFITKPMDYPKLRAILKSAESDIEMRQTSRKLTSASVVIYYYDLKQRQIGRKTLEAKLEVPTRATRELQIGVAKQNEPRGTQYRDAVFTKVTFDDGTVFEDAAAAPEQKPYRGAMPVPTPD